MTDLGDADYAQFARAVFAEIRQLLDAVPDNPDGAEIRRRFPSPPTDRNLVKAYGNDLHGLLFYLQAMLAETAAADGITRLGSDLEPTTQAVITSVAARTSNVGTSFSRDALADEYVRDNLNATFRLGVGELYRRTYWSEAGVVAQGWMLGNRVFRGREILPAKRDGAVISEVRMNAGRTSLRAAGADELVEYLLSR